MILKISFFLAAVLLLFSIFYHNVIEFDQDLGRHLLTGKIISETREVPKTNLYSYTQTDFPFVNSHWLSEVVFYQTFHSFGDIRVILYLKIVILLAAFGLTTYTANRFSGNLLTTGLAFVFLVPVLLERTEIRPEMFSYLFIAIFVYVLLLRPKLIWTLPILQILWVNMHIYFILGPVLVMIHALYSRRITFPAVLVFAVNLFNPNGIAGAIYPLNVLNSYGYSIQENQNLFFLSSVTSNPNITYFWIAFAFFIGSFFVSDWKKMALVRFPLAILAVLSIIHIRSLPLLFLFEMPVVAFNLANIRNEPIRRTGQKWGKIIVLGVIALTLFRGFRLMSNQYYLSTDSNKRFGNSVAESGKRVADFFIAKRLHGPIFNNFDIGSYLDWRLYPKERVFVDGRPEAYPVVFFQNLYVPMEMTTENFDKVDGIYHFNVIIFSHTDATPWAQQFLTDVIKNPMWKLVYLDQYAVMFVKKGAFPGLGMGELAAENLSDGKNYLDLLTTAQILNTFGRIDLAKNLIGKAFVLAPESPIVNKIAGRENRNIVWF